MPPAPAYKSPRAPAAASDLPPSFPLLLARPLAPLVPLVPFVSALPRPARPRPPSLTPPLPSPLATMNISASLLLAAVLLLSLSLAQDVNDSGALPDSAADGVPDAVIPNPRVSIAEYLRSTGEHDILLRALGLVPNETDKFSSPGTRFTVFAPTDSAIANLARALAPGADFDQNDDDAVLVALQTGLARLRELESSKYAELRNVLAYHVIGAAVPYARLEDRGRFITTQGDKLRFADGVVIDGDESRGNVTAGPKNVFALNGWIHVVHEVLLPFNLNKAIADAEAADIPMPSPAVIPSTSSTPAPTVTPEPEPGTVGPVTVPDGPEGTDEDVDDIIGTTDEPEISPSPEDDGPVCFPAWATVRLASGSAVPMHELAAGHEIHVAAGGLTSRVFLFTHRSISRKALFYKLTTASGHAVSLTGGHYLYANGALVAAEAVRVGDLLRTVAGDSQVVAVRRVAGEGLFAPHTVHGDLVVDGIVTSGYSTALHPKMAHALLAPVRMLAKYAGVVEPLGGLFYDGADALVSYLPKGSKRY